MPQANPAAETDDPYQVDDDHDQVEIKIGCDPEQLQDLVEHFTVLGSDTDFGLNARSTRQFPYNWSHFDGFGAGAKNRENFDRVHFIPF